MYYNIKQLEVEVEAGMLVVVVVDDRARERAIPRSAQV